MISGTTAIPFFINKNKHFKNLHLRSVVDNKQAYFVCKRLLDFFISIFIILFILSWLSILIAILIKIDSKGPVLFIQKRVGKTGKSFPCYKFRTMIVNPEADKKRAEKNDSRITLVGKILRHYNIDEFPQFFNVLIGHMSIVGPRPHMHSDCLAFSKTIPGYKFRTFIKPGITGLAQAKGFHGPVSNLHLIETRFKWDSYYVSHASFELDLRILHATVFGRLHFFFNCL